MGRFIAAPKALLPLWLLAAIVLAGTMAGGLVIEAGAPVWAGALATAAVSWGGAMLARRQLAARGRTGFEDLPSADVDYNDSVGVQTVSDMLDLTVFVATAAGAGAAIRAAGLGDGDVWGISTWFALGGVAAVPAVVEGDARYGLWVRRRRQAEEEVIEASPAPDAPGATRPDIPPRRPSGARFGDTTLTVPLDRFKALRAAAGAAALALAFLGYGAASVDSVEGILVIACAPFALFAAWRGLQAARRPYFLQLSREGVDPLGAGVIPWDALLMAQVVSHSYGRWLWLVLDEELGDQAWATSEVRRLTRRSRGYAVEILLRYSAWPAERVAAALREEAGVEVDALLA